MYNSSKPLQLRSCRKKVVSDSIDLQLYLGSGSFKQLTVSPSTGCLGGIKYSVTQYGDQVIATKTEDYREYNHIKRHNSPNFMSSCIADSIGQITY